MVLITNSLKVNVCLPPDEIYCQDNSEIRDNYVFQGTQTEFLASVKRLVLMSYLGQDVSYQGHILFHSFRDRFSEPNIRGSKYQKEPFAQVWTFL